MTNVTQQAGDTAVGTVEVVDPVDTIVDSRDDADASDSPDRALDGPRLPMALASAAVIGAAYFARAGIRRLSGAPMRRAMRRVRHALGG